MRLAQTQSPFSDQSARIDELTHAVKSDLARLQQALGVLETHVRSARSSSSTPQSNHAHEHAHSVVHALQGRLLDTTRGFARALQTRTNTLRAHEERRARIGAASSALNALRSAESAAAQDDSELSVAIAVPTLRQQSTTAQRSLLVERSDQVRDIESSIAEVQGVFRKLAELVTVQGELITRIEDNVLLSEVHANEAHRQLTHYLAAVSSDRWLAAKLFGVLLVFIFVFVLFFL
jgi:syntaxin 5